MTEKNIIDLEPALTIKLGELMFNNIRLTAIIDRLNTEIEELKKSVDAADV